MKNKRKNFHMKFNNLPQGFTLIEVLVVFSIIAFITSMIYSIIYTSRKTQQKHQVRMEQYFRIRSGLNKLQADLSSAYLSLGENMNLPERRTFFKGFPDIGGTNLQFSTFNHVRSTKNSKEADTCAVGYKFVDDPERPGKFILVRKESYHLDNLPFEELVGVSRELIPGVKYLVLEFYDARQDEWLEEWDTTNVEGKSNILPDIIRIHLVVTNGDEYELHFYSTVVPKLTESINLTPGGAASSNYMNINPGSASGSGTSKKGSSSKTNKGVTR
ncbi:MAG: prepilin-type N-terminal cleavage/methylation domain-containing protein [Deltaproteobacteria bacterium]|jgi:prepilin-type N-terminal cleavage/methylation domain-containing protein|nr:prepilin-type N-terminal cleavage/methylation domain-containing protein [Deltaproteobacteria bacterium]